MKLIQKTWRDENDKSWGFPERQIRCVKLTSIDANSVISWPNPMFDHLLESSRWDDSNKWSNIGFGQEIDVLEMKIRNLSGALGVPEYNKDGHDQMIPRILTCNPRLAFCLIWHVDRNYYVGQKKEKCFKLSAFLFISQAAKLQSNLDISNSDISNSAKFEASIWIKNTFWCILQQ